MQPAISFVVAARNLKGHLFDVEMTVSGLDEKSTIALRMPVWTPGSYLIREYAQHVMDLKVIDEDGQRRAVEKSDKATWNVDVQGCETITVDYKVYAFEISPRHNHLDEAHGFFNCVATCLYLEDRMDEPVGLEVVAPEGWEVFCGLEPVDVEDDGQSQWPKGNRFLAHDVDELFDTPVEMGPHQYFDFEVRGVPHRFLVWSEDDVDLTPFRDQIPRIVEQNASMYGGIPYDRYVFINHVIPGKWGGLEHRHSSVNLFSPKYLWDAQRDEDGEYDDDYANVLRLLSHEHYHAYHVKRLRPEALGPFDYQRENYTRALWAVEGMTSYFDTYHLLLADIIGAGKYMELLEKRITQLHEVPGRLVESLEESSFNAWIGLYRRNENTKNASVSYYLKGELVAWLIDLWIRDQSDGEKMLADALRQLWRDFYEADDVGYPPGAGEAAIGEVAGADATPIFDHLVRGAEPIRWEDFLTPFGLKLQADGPDDGGWLGIDTKGKGQQVEITFVATDSPAQKGGLYPGDKVVAVDGWSVHKTSIDEVLARREPGSPVEFHVIRRGRLKEVKVTVGQKPPESYSLSLVDAPTPRQLELLQKWLGETQWKEEQ